jgi:signal transduction histidine kinase/ActR/RegA family two-component response regulator
MIETENMSITSETERLRLVFMLCLFALVAASLWAAFFVFIEARTSALAAVIGAIGGLLGVIAAALGRRITASHIWLVFNFATVSLAAAAMDPSSNVKVFFPALALGAFLLFNDEKEIRVGLYYTLFAFVLWGLLAFHHKMSSGDFEIPYEVASGWLGDIVLLTAFAIIAIEAIYFRQILLRYSENYKPIAVRAQAANAAKSNFLAAMSHELRTPMNGVLGMSEILSQSKLEPAQVKMVSTIKESSLSLLGIIDDVLDTSQIEAGKMQLHPKPLDLRSHLLAVLDAVQPMADQRCLRFECDIPDGFDHVYLADDVRLRQILMNIIGNAVKYSVHDDGSTGETVSISLAEQDGKVIYTVIDRGVGMSDEMLADLFTPFTQFGDATRRRVGGTGLGLSISKRLIDLMDGQIEVHSTPGEGTWVQLTLPLERQAKLDEVPLDIDWIARLKSKAASYGPILLVEDNAVNRTVIEHQLRGLGLEYSSAEDGRKALEMWQDGSFELVLSDIHMPEMNGYDMSRAIRSKEAEGGLKPVPIVAITANALQGEAEKCFEAGMDAYLSKPVKLNDLAEKLEQMLSR